MKTTKRQSIKDRIYQFFIHGAWRHDLLLQLFLLVIAFLFIFLARVLFQKQEYITVKLISSSGDWWWYSSGPPQWLVDPIQKGDKEYNTAGKVIAEILDVQTYNYTQQRGSGLTTSEKTSIITAKLAVTKQKTSNQYRFRRDPLMMGAAMYIAPKNIRINCIPIWIEGGQEVEYKEKIITIKDYDIYPWRAAALVVGIKMVDGDGKTLAEIVDRKITPTLVYTYDQYGNLYTKESPIKVDIELKVKLLTTSSRGDTYFLFQPIRIGMPLQIFFSTVALVDPKIINID